MRAILSVRDPDDEHVGYGATIGQERDVGHRGSELWLVLGIEKYEHGISLRGGAVVCRRRHVDRTIRAELGRLEGVLEPQRRTRSLCGRNGGQDDDEKE